MAMQIDIDINRRGIGQVAQNPKLQAELLRRAQRVARQAISQAQDDDKPFIQATAITGQRRARASVMWRGGLPKEMRQRILGASIDAARD